MNICEIFSLTAPGITPLKGESPLEGTSKIWMVVSAFFSDLAEMITSPPGLGVLCFLATAGLGITLITIAESEGMASNKIGRVLLKIAAIAAFILSGALLASGIIFGIV